MKKEQVLNLINFNHATSTNDEIFVSVIAEYEFGIASLFNKKELLQVGDPVQFQVHLSDDFAVNIQATREKLRANVEAMKGLFPLLMEMYECFNGQKSFLIRPIWIPELRSR